MLIWQSFGYLILQRNSSSEPDRHPDFGSLAYSGEPGRSQVKLNLRCIKAKNVDFPFRFSQKGGAGSRLQAGIYKRFFVGKRVNFL